MVLTECGAHGHDLCRASAEGSLCKSAEGELHKVWTRLLHRVQKVVSAKCETGQNCPPQLLIHTCSYVHGNSRL